MEEFVCTGDGSAVWNEGNGTVDCYYHAELILSPCKDAIPDQNLSKLLKKNPFMTKDTGYVALSYMTGVCSLRR